MNKKSVLPQILLRKLILVGTRKNYEVNFRSGLNIIYGDSDTGKSSILNLIDYSLGAKSVFLYSEILDAGKYLLLEIKLNGKIYTIKRDIFDGNKDIEVFHTSLDNIENVFPKNYYANYSKKGELEYFSDFLLENLGVANVKVKKAPTKEDSEMVRLSFRDIFKYCYLNQDAVGSKHILDSNDGILKNKTQETFKYIFNLLDSNISQIQAELSDVRSQRDELIRKHKTVSSFLRETQLEGYEALINARNKIDDDMHHIRQEISKLNSEMISDSEDHDQLRKDIGNNDVILQELVSQNEINELQIKNNIILKKEYSLDIHKIEASLEVAEKIAGPTQHTFDCPLCSTPIPVDGIKNNFDQYDKTSLEKELRSVKKRLKEIDSLILSIKEDGEEIQADIQLHKSILKRLRQQLDSESKEFVSPFIAQLEKLISDKATLEESRKSFDYRIKVRSSLEEIDTRNIILDNKMSILREQLSILQDNAPTVDIVLGKIADDLASFLKLVKLKQAFGISLNSKSFLPIVRNTPYNDLTSGGVRTLVSIGYVISLLTYSLEHNTNHPKLILIDTVGKYLSKTSSKYQETDKASDLSEGITQSDATKYTEMYKQFILLNKLHDNFQLVVVDNDLPISLEAELQQYVIGHFVENGTNNHTRGFIDDVPTGIAW